MTTPEFIREDSEVAELIEEFFERRRKGEDLTIAGFLDEHPRQADALDELLPSLAMLDRVADESATAMRLPDRIGPYRIIRELGRGGMGVVFEAVQEPLGRTIALKVMNAVRWADPTRLRRFRREARATAHLDHPGICTVHDAGIEDGVPYIAMQLVVGVTLDEYVAGLAHGTCPGRSGTREIVRIFEEIARALEAAHAVGIIHRDVKPTNIMVTPERRPVLLDFGLASERDQEQSSLTATGETFGTPSYMAPEEVDRSLGAPDRRSDVFSLGVSLYECLTQRRPFHGHTRAALYQSIMHAGPPDLRRLNRDASPDLRVVVETALAKNPDHRYATAEAFADDLGRVARDEPILARPVGSCMRAWRWARRRRALAATLAALVVALGGFAATAGYVIAMLPAIRQAERQREVDRVEGFLEDGFLALADHEPWRAVPIFEDARAVAPDEPHARFGALLALLSLGEADRVLADLAASVPPSEHSMAFDLLEDDARRMATGRFTDREKDTEERRPATPLDHFALGARLLVEAHRSRTQARAREAVVHLSRAVYASRRARPLFHFMRAKAAYLARDAEAIEESFTSLPRLWPESARAWHLHGVLLQGESLRPYLFAGGAVETRFEIADDRSPADPRARAAFVRATELDPGYLPARLNLAALDFLDGNPQEAVRRCEELVAEAPGYTAAYLNLGVFCQAAGDDAGAEEAFRAGLRRDLGHAHLWRALGSHLLSRADTRGALAAFERALTITPGDAAVHVHIGVVHTVEGDFTAAAAAYRKALALDDTVVIGWTNLSHALNALGESDAALDAARNAIAVDPDHLDARNNLGLFLERAERFEEAIPHYREGCRLTANERPSFLRGLGRCLFEIGELEEAVEVLERASERLDERSPPRLASAVARFLVRARRELEEENE